MDATTLKSILKSFYNVFPEGMTFANLNTGDFIMIGANEKLVFDFDKIEKHLKEEKIKKTLKYHNINTAKDLMYYFALSRNEIVIASKNVPANTDLNILSEVRLSALNNKLSPNENPYNFLKNTYSFNVRPYLNSNIANDLEELGLHFLKRYNELNMAKFIVNQLSDIDQVKSRGIEYDILRKQYQFKKASELYQNFDDWPDRIHKQQALFLSSSGYENKNNIRSRTQ
jgi:hypothetical protein